MPTSLKTSEEEPNQPENAVSSSPDPMTSPYTRQPINDALTSTHYLFKPFKIASRKLFSEVGL